MSPNLALFLFGALITVIVMMGLAPFYLVAYVEQAEREGYALPGILRRVTVFFGLKPPNELPESVRSEPKP